MSKHIHVAVLDLYDGYPNEGMRCIKMLLGEFMAQGNIKGNYDIFNVRGGQPMPEIADYDIFISSGGPGSPLFTGSEWERNYRRLLSQIITHNKENENKKFLFLICHSFQMAVQHFDFGKITKRKSTSFGVMKVHKDYNGINEPLFEGLEDPFWAVDSRDYQFIQPDYQAMKNFGAEIVALEKIRPHVPLDRAVMAIRFSPEVFGTQFHPEADAEGMKRYFLQEDKKKAIIQEYGIDKYFEMMEHLDDPDKIMLTESVIIPKFLNNAAESILQTEMA